MHPLTEISSKKIKLTPTRIKGTDRKEQEGREVSPAHIEFLENIYNEVINSRHKSSQQ